MSVNFSLSSQRVLLHNRPCFFQKKSKKEANSTSETKKRDFYSLSAFKSVEAQFSEG